MSEKTMITIIFSVKPGQVDQLEALLVEAFKQTRQREGCIGIRTCRHADSDKIILVEEWASRRDYDAYMSWRLSRGESPDTLNGLLAAPPDVNFWKMRAE